MNKKKLAFATRAIHGSGYHPSEDSNSSVVSPLYRSTIFEHTESGLRPDEEGYSYTRLNNPNRAELEMVLANLENGSHCSAFASGMAAVHAVLQLLDQGGHILLAQDIYHGTKVLVESLDRRDIIDYSFVDMRDEQALRNAISDNTQLIWLETPSNPMLQIIDVATVAKVVRAQNSDALVAVDNTWPTPANMRPLELGADISVHSTTKYLGGHSDLLGGAVVMADKAELNPVVDRLKEIQWMAGAVPSPEDCWWLTRSIKTLPYRIRAHNDHAMKIAKWLEQQSKVEKVYYPGLTSHQGHEIAARQMDGFGGMISFEVVGGAQQALSVVNASKLIIAASSLGGVESTWEHRLSSENENSTTSPRLIRLSVGLEDPEDIIADIEQAMENLE